MRKIFFNDKYGLTDAVLQGRKTMTRRVIKQEVDIARHFNPALFSEGYDPMAFYRDERGLCRLIDTNGNYIEPKYKKGEVVAVAQSYKSIFEESLNYAIPRYHWLDDHIDEKGYTNKMYVRADLMPHKIRITDIKVERLQDISDEDCLKEGVYMRTEQHPRQEFEPEYTFGEGKYHAQNPHAAFAALIDAVSGKGTWESNPYVFCYSFELIK